MAPSAALQSRIKAFEELQNTSSSSSSSSSPALNATTKPRPLDTHVTTNSMTNPKPAPQPIFNDLDLLDSEPVTPSSSDPLNTIKPLVPVSVSRSPSPAALGRKSSLIHFSELAGLNTGGSNGSAGSGNSIGTNAVNGTGNGNGVKSNVTGSTTSSTSEIMLGLGGIGGGMGRRAPQLPPRPGSTTHAHSNPPSHTSTPPLPPRKPSLGSLRMPSSSSSSSAPPPPLPRRNGSAPTSSTTSLINQPQAKPPSRTPTNLLAPTPHTYPPTVTSPGGSKIRHAPSGSTSSFHSVSLSSDGGDTHEDSLDGSYEAVSSTVATSPVSSLNSWEQDTAVFNSPSLNSNAKPWPWQKGMSTNTPPVLVSSPTGTSMKSQETINALLSKRPPPLPPQRKSPPSSTTSTAVSSPTTPHASIIKPTSRPVPIPPASKARYDALFERNIRIHCMPPPQVRKRSSQSGGWRGPSLDLTSLTKTEPLSGTNTPLNEDRLPAAVIKHIWKASKLPRERLRDIWNECDPDRVGSLDKEAFARGMWRIDETLRVAQLARTKKSPPRPPPQKQPQAYASHAVAYAPRVPLRRTNFIKT